MFPILRRFDWSEIKSWDALEKVIGGLPTQQARGEAFEEFSLALLELHKDYYQATKIWRCRDVPDEILDRLGCSTRQDVGIDGVMLHYDNTLTAYQSKFRLDRSDTPSQRELSTFYMVSDRADFRIVIANVEDLPKVVRERKAHGQYLVDSLLNLPEEFFTSVHEYIFHERTKLGPPPQPRPFQVEVIVQSTLARASHASLRVRKDPHRKMGCRYVRCQTDSNHGAKSRIDQTNPGRVV